MNRRERKQLEKRLGLTKHLKTLTRQQRFDRMRENIIEGNKKEKAMKEVRRLQEEGAQIEVDNNQIASLATELMLSENLSYIDALEKAKQVYSEKAEQK
jgi:uncharacterized membrane protein (DUF106 family)